MTTKSRTKGPQHKEQEEHGFSLDELQEWKTQLEKTVRDHPILAAGIAVGAGVLIARLIKDALGDEPPPRKRRGGKIRELLGSEVGRALMGSAATMVAAKIQEAMMEHAVEEVEAEAAPVRRRRRPAKQGRAGARKRPRRPSVEE